MTDEENWDITFNKVKTYIDTNKITPNRRSINEDEKKLGMWIDRQNYKFNRQNMLNLYINEKWEQFINDEKYKKLLQSKYNIK